MKKINYSDSFQSEKRAKHYNENEYHERSPDSLLWSLEKELFTRIIKKNAPQGKQLEALDFACGTGRITGFLKQHFDSVTGVDISQEMLDVASENVEGAEFIQADILESPTNVPGEKDIITSFRFLLNAEPKLREDCIRILGTKLRSSDSIIILGLHGNPYSIRILGSLRRMIIGGKISNFSMKDMELLASKCGLTVVDAGGLGYLPHILVELIPFKISFIIEKFLADRPFLWRFGKNLIVACKKSVD